MEALGMISLKGRTGAVASVSSAAERRVGELVPLHVIPNSHDDVEQFLPGRKTP